MSDAVGTVGRRPFTNDNVILNARIIAADPVMSQDINVEHLNMKFPKLSYTEALNATRDHHLGKVNLLNGVSIIEVTKYIPFPKRREYGIAFQLRG